MTNKSKTHKSMTTNTKKTSTPKTVISKHTTFDKPVSKTRKLLTYGLAAAMINTTLLPAHAAVAEEKRQAQVAHNQNSDDAVTQMIELAAKHALQVDLIKDTEAQTRAGRNIFKRMVDGVVELFTDSNEEIALDDANDATTAKLLALVQQTDEEHKQLIAELQQQKQDYINKGFDQKTITEQDQLIAEMNKRYHTLKGLTETLAKANTDSSKQSALDALNKQLVAWQPKVANTDMENLPWGTPQNTVREPIVKESSAISKASISNRTYNTLNKQPTTAIGEWQQAEYKIGNYLLNQQPIQKINQYNGMTSAGDWTVLNALPKEVQTADLTETDAVQITEDIKALAKQLDHNPAKIYAWVYDNIEFVPTYGSIQGSAFTLETKRGNATDTASLLIALLRASNIPARYVYGTVDVPAKFAMEWVGGVHNIDAVQNLIGQGGIPNIVVMNGSVPKYLRLEHVWVEANVDWIGSRGSLSADKTNNNAKQWIPLDATYKTHIETQGIDLAKAVPFDAEKLIADAQQGATIDEATGSVQHLNQDAIKQALDQYQTDVTAYLEQNHPNATVGDVLGTSKIEPWGDDTLPPMLPYRVKTVISDYQALPDNMKHYFIVNVFQDIYERNNSVALGDNPSFHVKIPTTQLQGKPLALSFKGNDEQLKQYLPEPDANGDIDPSKLPTGFSRSVSMTAEVTLGNDVLKTGASFPFGTEVNTQLGFQAPNTGISYSINTAKGLSDKIVRAGEYHAIGYDMQGMSQKQLENLQKRMLDTSSKLKTKNTEDIISVNSHDLIGSILQANVISYFSVNDKQDMIAKSQVRNIVSNRFMSYGTFHTFIKPKQRYGVIFGGQFKGLQMDIDRLQRQIVSTSNNISELKNFIMSQGERQSLNENLIPEQILNANNSSAKYKGISAVKAINIANQQGQKIYLITKTNQLNIIPKLSHNAQVMTDIRNALNSGKTVQIHEKPISYNGWNGSGYVILDPTTGSGAYLIGGGLDGAMFAIFGAWLSTLIVSTFYAAITGALATGGIGLAGLAVVLPLLILTLGSVILSIKSMARTLASRDPNVTEDFLWGCFKTGMLFGLNGALIGFNLNKRQQFANLLFGGLFSVPSASDCVTGWTL